MPSCNTYHLTWVSLTLVTGYLFTSAPAKHRRCSLPWTRGISSRLLPDLACGITPLGPPELVQPPLLGRGVTYLSHHPRSRAWVTSSWQLLRCPSLAHSPATPDLWYRVTLLGCSCAVTALHFWPPPMTLDVGYLLPADAPNLRRGVAPLIHPCAFTAWHTQPLPLIWDVGKLLLDAASQA